MFLFTLVAIAAALSAVMVPIFFGHGLSEGRPAPMLIALGWLLLSALLFTVLKHLPRRGAAARTHAEH